MIPKIRDIDIIKDDHFQNDVLSRKESGSTLTAFVLSANESVVIFCGRPIEERNDYFPEKVGATSKE